MAYTAPTTTDFKLRFPQFGEISDARVNMALSEASLFVSTAWAEPDYAPGILFLAAHDLSLEPPPTATPTPGATTETAGALSDVSVGDVRVKFGSGSGATASTANAGKRLEATVYGRKYLELRNRNRPLTGFLARG